MKDFKMTLMLRALCMSFVVVFGWSTQLSAQCSDTTEYSTVATACEAIVPLMAPATVTGTYGDPASVVRDVLTAEPVGGGSLTAGAVIDIPFAPAAAAAPGTPATLEICIAMDDDFFNENWTLSFEGTELGTGGCGVSNLFGTFTKAAWPAGTDQCVTQDCRTFPLTDAAINAIAADGFYTIIQNSGVGVSATLCPNPDYTVNLTYYTAACPNPVAIVNGDTFCTPGNAMLPPGDYCITYLGGVYDATGCTEMMDMTQVASVVDGTAPTFDNCPADDILLSAGPGECEVVWNYPEITASDNCDVMGGALTRIEECPTGAGVSWRWSFATSGAIMFDVNNLSGDDIELINAECDLNNIGGTPGNYAIEYTPGPFLPVAGTPGAWIPAGTATIAGQMYPNLEGDIPIATVTTSTDTILVCGEEEIITTSDSTGIVIPAGGTVGIHILSTGPIVASPLAWSTGSCSQYDDGVLQIDGSNSRYGEAPLHTTLNFTANTFFPRVDFDYRIAGAASNVAQVDTTGLGPGCLFPIGETCLIYEATDDAGNVSTCEFCVVVSGFANPITALACNDNIQLSLDETCMATIGADLVLEGGPYACYDDYIVLVKDDRGNLMDMDGDTSNGTQLGWTHLDKCFEVTVIDPTTGNSCWGEICVEDKLPPVVTSCPNDTLDCEANSDPTSVGGSAVTPTVSDACNPFVATTYVDWVTDGSCATGFERIISRRWTFTDASGNSATCEQTILVELATLFDVALPGNYDDLNNPALLCDEKIDDKDRSGHILDFPFCVDGYLLDSAIWLATGGDPTITNPDARDLSGQRLPRTLGWNCLDSGPYAGHPSPIGVYYEPHPQWEFFGVCWGPNQIFQWAGTGMPMGAACSNIIAEYRDTKINLYDPECNAGDVGCYKILRQWTLIDWCTGEVGGHNQIIKVLDDEGPEVLAPDNINAGTTAWECLGQVDVPVVWITDNCSEDVDYRVVSKEGTVIGNSTSGYRVVDLPLGQWPLYIEAFDCCGNTTIDSIIVNVIDDTPPVCIAEDRLQLSLAGNQSPGSNFAAICAEDMNKASYDNCTQWLWYKTIRMDELLGTVNGSFADNTIACGGVNGDDDGLIQGNQVYFDDCTKFCCEDADQIIMVVLRVHDVDPGVGPVNPLRYTPPAGDLVGRFTDCWVEIDVRDKAQPIVVAPPDMVVSCMFWFDDSEDALSDVNNSTFGRVVTDLADREKVKTLDTPCEEWCEDHPKYDYEPSRNRPAIWSQACDFFNLYFDPAHPDDKYELVWGFDGYVVRTCGATPTIRVDDRRECGQGVINRDVIVTYQDAKTGGVVTFRDRQEIWVIDCDPFYVTEDCFDDEDCVDWPLFCQQPDPIDGCGADLDPYTNPDLGFPVIQNGCDDNCALIVVEYNDEEFVVEPDACFKVIRTWIVIDWCQYDPLAPETRDGDNPNEVTLGRWEFVQVINVRDKIDPVLTIDVGDCNPADTTGYNGVCHGYLELCATATDDCSPDDWITYDYKIDLYNDGTGKFGDFDLYVGKLTPRQFANGTVLTQTPQEEVTDCHTYRQAGFCNDFAEDPTQPFCATGTYPVGTHVIYWFAEDGCGNVVKDTATFEVKDCKEPTPYCKTGIITVVMPVNGEICVWANDLDDGSFDNCTRQENLKFYFNGDTSMTSYCVNCDTFEARGADDKLLIDVQVWVEDEEGNTDFCITTIEIQDNQDICEGSGSIVGNVENAMMQDMVEYAEITLNSGMRTDVTEADGRYTFGGLDFTNPLDVTIGAYRNDDPLNGVSTKDLVAIQRHLLGGTQFTSGYQMIAADVNNNQDVSSADISALRRVILGSEADFSKWNQTSWRFVDARENLTDNTNPWPFAEEISYNDVNTNMFDVDFDAIKVGDVTADAQSNGAVKSSTRTGGKLVFAVADANVTAGDSYTMDVTAENFKAIAGYQFTMKYDAAGLTFAGIESGALTVSEANLGLTNIANGVITMSWNNASGQATSVEDATVLFSITFDAAVNAKASDLIRVTSEITRAEAYGADLDDRGLSIEFRNEGGVVEIFELYQNTPNPFDASTVISYTLPNAMPAVLTVYDVAGRVVMVKDVAGNKGYNETELTKAELNGAGVLYYQLDAADYTATKRMVLID